MLLQVDELVDVIMAGTLDLPPRRMQANKGEGYEELRVPGKMRVRSATGLLKDAAQDAKRTPGEYQEDSKPTALP